MIVSFFEHARNPRPLTREISWARLAVSLRTFRPIQGTKDDRLGTCPLWSPCRFREGGRRSLGDAVEVSLLVLDYDDGATIDDALGSWPGLEAVAHTSWSHTEELPRCRLVLPLAYPLPVEAWSELYGEVVADADRACRDPSRAYFLPAIGAGGPHRAKYRPGERLDLTVAYAGAEARLQKAAEDKAARQRLARSRARDVYQSADDLDREVRRRLRVDPDARERLALDNGAKIIERPSGRIAKGVACPACGRPSVMWYLDPTKKASASCHHKNSCGWYGPLTSWGNT